MEDQGSCLVDFQIFESLADSVAQWPTTLGQLDELVQNLLAEKSPCQDMESRTSFQVASSKYCESVSQVNE